MGKEIREFFRFAEVGKTFVVLLLLRCPFDFLMSMYYANLMEQAFEAMENKNEQQLFTMFGMFLIAAALLFLYNGTIWSLFAPYVVKMQARVRKKLFHKITSLSYQTVSESGAGEWVTRMNSDTQIAADLIGGVLNIPHAAIAAFNITISAFVLAVLDFKMFLLSLCFILPHLFLSQHLLAKPMTGLREQVQKELGRMTSWIEPVITASEVVQIYDADEFLHKKIEESSLALRSANMKIHRKNALGSGLMPVFGISGYLAMILYGGSQISAGKYGFGQLTKLIQYRGGMLSAIMMEINCSMNIRGNLAGVKRVNEVTKMK